MITRRPIVQAAFLVALLAALPALTGSGCSRGAGSSGGSAETAGLMRPRHSGAAAAASSGLVETDVIERSPAYRQAVLAFSGKDYRGALSQIDALLKTPDLSPSASAFLQHQRLLCQAAITGRKAVTEPPPAAISAESAVAVRHPRTAADADCGPRALLLVCQALKIPAGLEPLRKAAGTTADGTTMAGLTKAAQSVGLQAEGVQMDRDALSNLTKPAIAWSSGNHYVAVLAVHHSLMDPSVNGGTANESGGFIATVHDPNNPREEEMPLSGPTGLLARSGGMLLLLSQNKSLASAH